MIQWFKCLFGKHVYFVEGETQKVYGRKCSFPDNGFVWSETKKTCDTHEAVISDIKETERLKCKHESVATSSRSGTNQLTGECRHCGRTLVAKWEEI